MITTSIVEAVTAYEALGQEYKTTWGDYLTSKDGEILGRYTFFLKLPLSSKLADLNEWYVTRNHARARAYGVGQRNFLVLREAGLI